MNVLDINILQKKMFDKSKGPFYCRSYRFVRHARLEKRAKEERSKVLFLFL